MDNLSGRVGFGSTNPGSKLDVVGNVFISSSLEVGIANLFANTLTGNVGIGTTTPQTTLDVAGPLRINDGLSNISDFNTGFFEGYVQQAILKASDPVNQKQLGFQTTISGDGNYLVSGAQSDHSGGVFSGALYVFIRNGTSWSQQAKLKASPVLTYNYLGKRPIGISTDGTYVITGTEREDTTATNSGAAYIWVRSGTSWSQQVMLKASDAAQSDNFGQSNDISGNGNYAIVGAPYEDDGGTNVGAAYIFIRSGTSWSQQVRLKPSNPTAHDNFGWHVALSGDGTYAIVSAQYEDTGASQAGSVYVFIRSGTSWSEQARLQHSDVGSQDQSGGLWNSIDISGNGLYVAVGVANQYDPAGVRSGAVYIYIRNGTSWSQQAKLLGSGRVASSQTGCSLSINGDGDYLAVGRATTAGGASGNGGVIVFVRSGTTWNEINTFIPDPSEGDNFGRYGVGISDDGTYAVAGSPYEEDTGGNNTGAAYVFVPGDIASFFISTAITAKGTLLSFTGQHTCFPEGRMSQGLVVSANQNKYMSLNGPITMDIDAIKSSESLPVVSLSNVANDRSVFGVVDRVEGGGIERTQTIGIGKVSVAKEVGDNRVIVNSLGEGALWVANTNGNLVSGDYLTTSSLPGYGQKQDSDSLKNYTVAKITMDCDFSPRDLPVQVIKRNENGENDLDVNGRFQWEDHLTETKKAYKIRYLDVNGRKTVEANTVHKAAFVGCTYHCG